MRPEARAAMEPWLAGDFGSPSGLHAEGLRAREAVGRAREQLAALIGAEGAENVIFTSGGTEAVNLAVKGAALANLRRGRQNTSPGGHVVLSAAEHPAVARSVDWLCGLEGWGFTKTVVPVDAAGRIDPEAVREAIREGTTLVCAHHANHDIGTIQAVARIGEITSERGVPLFVDAVASAGWVGIDVKELKADLLAISPGRFGGPKGVGALYRHRRARVQSLLHGGEQEEGRRAGMENVAGIAGAGTAAEMAGRDLAERAAAARKLQRMAWEKLRASVPRLKLNGAEPGAGRHPGNLNLSAEFAEGEALALRLDARGIALTAGAACVTRSQRVPPVLAAIGLPEGLAKGTVIASFGSGNTAAEAEQFAEEYARAIAFLREMSPEWEDFQRGAAGAQ